MAAKPSTAKTAFFHDEKCLWHSTGLHALVMPVGGWVQPPAGGGHAESPETKRRFKALMDVSGLSNRLDQRTAPPAGEEDLRRVHDAGYLRQLKALSDAGGGELGEQSPFGPGSYEIAALSAGLAIAAVDGVIRGEFANAYALSRPPGHHCLRDHSKGFCLLANIAIAVEAAIARHRLSRIAVLDWDVHHGNGTQAIFYDRPDVLTISLHQEGCYPPGGGQAGERGLGRGEGYNVNIPLLPGGGHASYREAMRRIVVPVIDRYRPELLIIASGFDANAVDPLARMQLYSESYRALALTVMELARRHCAGRLVLVHEGGYSEAYVPFCGHAVVEAISGEAMGVEDPFLDLFKLQQPSARFEAFQDQLLDEQAQALGL